MTIPNILTFFRLLLTPIFVWVFFQDGVTFALLTVCVSALIEVTDYADGQLARRFGWVTDFGKLFDPFADSLSRLTIFICFFAEGYFPVWMPLILYWRDSSIAFLRMLAANRKFVLAARISGKVKAVMQAIVINLVLVVRAGFAIAEASPEATAKWVGGTAYIAMFAVVAVTVYSFFEYMFANRQILISYLSETGEMSS